MINRIVIARAKPEAIRTHVLEVTDNGLLRFTRNDRWEINGKA
jgi:hypothetical protein